MPRQALRIALVVFAALLALPLLSYLLREPLARLLIAASLPEDAILERLDGLELSPVRTGIAALDVRLDPALRLEIRDIELRYALAELWSRRALASASATSVTLVRVADPAPPPDAEAGESNPSATPDMRVSEVLALLRDFPVDDLTVPVLALPGSPEPLALKLHDTGTGLELQLAGDSVALDGTFRMPEPAGTAELELGLAAAGAMPLELRATLVPDGESYALDGRGAVRLPDVGAFFADQLGTTLVPTVAAVELDWQLRATLADAALDSPLTDVTLTLADGAHLAFADGLVAGLDRLDATLGAASELHLRADAGLVLTETVLPLRVAGLWQGEAFQAAAEVRPRQCRLGGTPGCEADFTLGGSLAALALGTGPDAPRLYDIALEGAGALTQTPAAFEVALAPGLTLATANVNGAGFSIERLAFASASPIRLRRTEDAPPALAADAATLLMHGLKSGGFEIGTLLHLEALALTLGEAPAGTLKLWTENTYLGHPDELPVFELDVDMRIADRRIDFTLGSGLDGIVEAEGSHDLANGSGSLAARVPEVTFMGAGDSFSSRLRNWHFPYDVLTGTLAANVNLEWRPETIAGMETVHVTGMLDARLAEAGGYYGEIFFAGVDTAFAGTIDTAQPLALDLPRARLRIGSIDAGVPLHDIVVDFAFEAAANTFAIPLVRAQLLDGSISADDFRYDFGAATNSAEVNFQGLRIERLLDLVEYRGVEASGALSGSIPLAFGPDGLRVAGGRLYAEPPGGVIHYVDSAALAGANPALTLMNQALGNYEFHSLESGIDYAPDGELLLSMKLQGTNPDMNNGQMINLNLNVSDNIPTLLESLQAGRAIEDFITTQADRRREENAE